MIQLLYESGNVEDCIDTVARSWNTLNYAGIVIHSGIISIVIHSDIMSE